VLHREEFFDDMCDPRVEKYVVWAASGRPVGMTTLTRHLETVPWISPEFFAARFPDHSARNAIYYLGFTLVHPAARDDWVLTTMLDAIFSRLVLEDAVLSYDVCGHNNNVLQLAARVESVLRRSTDLVIEPLDSQTYYYVTHRDRPRSPAGRASP
jgi:hypothetical protein